MSLDRFRIARVRVSGNGGEEKNKREKRSRKMREADPCPFI